jgi:putative peptidoglycan lipid II flippase
VSEALFWFSFALPLNGVNLLLTRTFFSFREPWLPVWMALLNVGVNLVVSIALAGQFDIAGVVIGTIAGNLVMVAGQIHFLRRQLHGFEGRRTLAATAGMTLAAAAAGGAAYGVWAGLDAAFGRALAAQVVSVGAGCLAGATVYAAGVALLRIPEAAQLWRLLVRRWRPAP